MEQETKILPTWGYKPDGSAQIFDLTEGASLPEGWFDRPGPQESGAEIIPQEPEAAAEAIPQAAKIPPAPKKPRRG